METDALAPNLQLNQQNKMSIDETLKKSQEEGDKMLKDNEVVK